MERHRVSLSGQTAVLEAGSPSDTWARAAEIFNPSTKQWDVSSTPPTLLQLYYPPSFVIPGAGGDSSRVITVARNDSTYWIDIASSGNPSGSWIPHKPIGFSPLTGVLYRPDSVMVAGTEHGGPVGSTKTLAISSSMSNSWVGASDMQPRAFHNLVLLPNGKVLVVGGKRSTEENDINALYVRRPQIWDPATGNWTTYADLDSQNTRRGYHSTAILLPDGRVLSAGGEDPLVDRFYGDIYCPPYLFKSDGTSSAARPVVNCAPKRIAWRQPFTLNLQDSTYRISRACLIRPAATTHAFDQNQRYVPLTMAKAENPPRVFLTAPASPDSAPPGYYMIFVTGTGDNADVPSIARWVRLGGDATRDTCDAIRPDTVALSVDAVGSHNIYVSWIAPADDASLSASGPAREFDLRYWVSPINSESAWNASNPVSGEPTPGAVGSYYEWTFSSLQSCTWYHFANRAWDDNNQLSNLHAQVKAKTTGTCLDQFQAPQVRSASIRATARGTASSEVEATTAQATSAATIVETRRSPTGGWGVLVRAVSESAGLAGADSTGIVMQVPDGAGGWNRRAHFDPASGEDVIGLCALRDENRAVLLGSHALEGVARTLESGSRLFALASASHSRTGDVLARGLTSESLSLSAGDSLRLAYEPADSVTGESQVWFALFQRLAAATSPQAGMGQGAAPTYIFALGAARPNPSSASVNFSFTMATEGPALLRVYDVAGRLVRTLINGNASAGPHELTWDASDDRGRRVGAGVYFYRMDAGPWRSQRKVVFLER